MLPLKDLISEYHPNQQYKYRLSQTLDTLLHVAEVSHGDFLPKLNQMYVLHLEPSSLCAADSYDSAFKPH